MDPCKNFTNFEGVIVRSFNQYRDLILLLKLFHCLPHIIIKSYGLLHGSLEATAE